MTVPPDGDVAQESYGNPAGWDAGRVRELRETLQLTQRELAAELGVRQQTVSEWEQGVYAPRGASARLLTIVSERGAPYGASRDEGMAPADD